MTSLSGLRSALVDGVDDLDPVRFFRLAWCRAVAVDFIESQFGKGQQLLGNVSRIAGYRRQHWDSRIAIRSVERDHYIK